MPRSRVYAPILNSAWSSHTFAPPCANACAVFRPCGLRFAPCPRGSSRFAASDAHKLACGTPCFIGVFVPACASLARYSGAAERCALSSPLHPFGASTATACFRHWRRPSCASSIRNGRPAAPYGLQYSLAHWAYYGLFRALRAAFVRPVISDESLVLPILCQCSGPLAEKICAARPVQERAAQNLPTFFRKWST